MADQTHIEWTDATWNPVTGCSVVSPGCTNCYAMRLAGTRLRQHPSRAGLTHSTRAGPVWTGEVRFNAEWLRQPMQWRRPRRIFVCAHSDLFHEDVPEPVIDQVFAVMLTARHHTYQVLTKRPDRMAAYLGAPGSDQSRWRYAALRAAIKQLTGAEPPADLWFLRHIWLGFSAEDQTRFDERWAAFAGVTSFGPKFLSLEPMLGPVDLRFRTDHCDLCGGTGILARWPKGKCHVCGGRGHVWINGGPRADCYRRLDWVILGGENGPRPMHPAWARQIRNDCAKAGVPFFFKQWGSWVAEDQAPDDVAWPEDATPAHTFEDGQQVWKVGKRYAGRHLDGHTHDALPEQAR